LYLLFRLLTNLKKCPAACRTLSLTIQALLKNSTDLDHLVRGQGISAFGSLLPVHWTILERSSMLDWFPKITGLHKHKTDQKYEETARDVIFFSLIKCSCDSIGTVRSASFKAIGDSIANNGLQLSSYRRIGPSPTTDIREKDANIIERFLLQLRAGCGDSKLLVRIQACGALGNLLNV
jgi:hypothetical protein